MVKTFFKSHNFITYYQNNTINKERDYNVLLNKDHITGPPKIIKKNNLFFITCQNNIITKVDKKEKLNQFYKNTQEFHIYYRKIIAIYVKSKKN